MPFRQNNPCVLTENVEMKIQNKSMLRRLILEQLSATYPCGCSQNMLNAGLQTAGVNLSDDELISELAYLTGKGYAATKKDSLSMANVFYFITAQGLEILDS